MNSNNSDGWDVFISHASEDKDEIARPLAISLMNAGVRVWYDEFTLKIGDSLSMSIDNGLSKSKYGIIIISENFLSKNWTQKELSGLFAKEDGTNKIILPIWHNITYDKVKKHSLILADRFALSSSLGLSQLTQKIISNINFHSVSTSKSLEIEGLWLGSTGRLRIYQFSNGIIGDYDWNGKDWSGHISGKYSENILLFDWNWDFSPEKGNGFFKFNGYRNTLEGVWAFDYQNISYDNIESLPIPAGAHAWSFSKRLNF